MTPTLTQKLATIRRDCESALELAEKATDGPWSWQGEDYRGGWGWKLLVSETGEGIACGESPSGPYKNLRAFMPIDAKFCKTGAYADKDSAPCLCIQEQDAAFIAPSRTLLPAAARAILTMMDALENNVIGFNEDVGARICKSLLQTLADQWPNQTTK